MKRVQFSVLPARLFKHSSPSEGLQGIDRRAYLATGFTVVMWASAFPGIRAALQDYTPAHIALIRYITASLVLAVYALIARIRLPASTAASFFCDLWRCLRACGSYTRQYTG